jgi:hypothetical protein
VTPEEDPRYTDEQFALALKRAAERQAAGEEPARAPTRAPLFGPPSACRLTRRLTGTLQAGDHAAAIAAIRDHMPYLGVAQQIGDGVEWHCGPADNKTVVTLTRADRETVVRIDGRYHGPKIMLYLAAGLLTALTGGVGAAVAHSPLVGVGLGLGTLVVSFAGARALWNAIATRARRRAEQLMEALAEQLRGL